MKVFTQLASSRGGRSVLFFGGVLIAGLASYGIYRGWRYVSPKGGSIGPDRERQQTEQKQSAHSITGSKQAANNVPVDATNIKQDQTATDTITNSDQNITFRRS